MNERLMHMCLTILDPTDTNTMDNLEGYFEALFPMDIVGVSVAPILDSASATLDIDDDGANVISGIDASDANVPGTWKSTHIGGANAIVSIAKGSKVSFDINSGTAAIAYIVHVWYLLPEILS